MVEAIVPLMLDRAPPVTRLITFWVVAGPLKVALSPAFRPNCRKTVEEVAADLFAEVRAYRVVGSNERLGRREAAVNRDILRRCDQGGGCEQAGGGKHERILADKRTGTASRQSAF